MWRMSRLLPMAKVQVSCTMNWLEGVASTLSQAQVMLVAALAARPSMWACTVASCSRKAWHMASAAKTSPPGQLMRRWMVSASMARTAGTKSCGHTPPQYSAIQRSETMGS